MKQWEDYEVPADKDRFGVADADRVLGHLGDKPVPFGGRRPAAGEEVPQPRRPLRHGRQPITDGDAVVVRLPARG
jgi:hypothetical protein